jgi:hypothetical protein
LCHLTSGQFPSQLGFYLLLVVTDDELSQSERAESVDAQAPIKQRDSNSLR